MKRLVYGIALIIISAGCGSGSQTPSSKASSAKSPAATNPASPSKAPGTAPKTSDTKKPAAPKLILVPKDTANIGPSELYCSFLTKPTEAAPSAVIGCRFEEAGKRTALSAIAETIKFAANVGTGVTYTALTSDTETWDVVYNFKSESYAATQKCSLAIVFTNTLTGENRQTMNMVLGNLEI